MWKCREGVPFFDRPKIIIIFFITSCILNIFMLPNFFREQQYFLRKVQRTIAAAHLTIFLGRETFVSGIKLCTHEHAAYALHHLYVACKRRMVINFSPTWGEQRIPGAWKGHRACPVLFVFAQKTQILIHGEQYANYSWMAQRRFAVPSTHMHIWFANHSVRSCIQGFRYQIFCY